MQVTSSLQIAVCRDKWLEFRNMSDTPHVVRQVIRYSDGTETVINYRGVIENGVLTEDNPEVKPKKPTVSKPKGIVSRVKKLIKGK